MTHLDFTLILALTNILKGSKVESESIAKSLAYICENTDFDGGLVYELDHFNQFCLKERYAPKMKAFSESFDATALMNKFENDDIVCVLRNEQNTPLEKYLFASYGASLLVVSPVFDENAQISGMVLLFDLEANRCLPTQERQVLQVLLSILISYVGLRMYHQKLKQTHNSLDNILDNTGIDIYVNDFYTHDILYANKSMAAPYGGREKFMGNKCWKVLFPGQEGPCEFCPQKMIVDEHGEPTKVYTWDYQRQFDGEWFRVFSAAFPWVDGRMAHVVSSANITDNKKNEAMIEYLANYDQLANLPNRRMLLKDCENRITNSTQTIKGYVLFMDIDGFKAINDTYGHDAGDEFLIQLAAFYSNIPLMKNAVFRNGGDEFVALINDEAISKENIESLGYFIHERFQKPWILKKGQIYCGTSIGVACYPEDGKTVEMLLQKADETMYYVKKTGGGRLCFNYEMEKIIASDD